MKTTVEVKSKKQIDLTSLMKSLGKKVVLVGIPSDSGARPDGAEISNAQLGYIHEFGAPASGIPPRPFLVKGVKGASDTVKRKLKGALKAGLHGDETEAERLLNQAGSIAASSVKSAIRDGDFAPLKPSTIANRNRGRATKSKRMEEKLGVASAVRPLINTSSMLNSITYVVK